MRTPPSALLLTLVLVGCPYKDSTSPAGTRFANNPCAPGTVSLAVAASTRVDCSNGGATVTLDGAGASYLVVPQFATDQAANQIVAYGLASGTLAALTAASRAAGSSAPPRPNLMQLSFDRALRERARSRWAGGAIASAALMAPTSRAAIAQAPPPVGSVRNFQVLNSISVNSYSTVAARLAYADTSILLYVDTLAPAGFSATDLQNFGKYFGLTLYPIDTTAFGGPSDVDGNKRVIMVMSQVVNAMTPSATCASQGYIAGFFNSEDFTTSANSNQGEVFYSIVPDSNGTYSCSHPASAVTATVPAVFLHELQHLISFSQHAVVGGGSPADGWLDEGLSIVSEELGAVYWEQKCPPPSCRTNSAQLFPDSAQGFVQSFLGDSYAYAFLPDTASITLHNDAQFGFDWRGGAWLLMRWLGDQNSAGFYRALERGPANGIQAIQAATGQNFPALFANFGLSLYTDSLPGLSRTTAPAVNRFTSRNVRQLWDRWSTTHGGPLNGFPSFPIFIASVTADTSSIGMTPGTMSFWRLDTPTGSPSVTIRFAAPGGAAFAASLKAQLAIFRLPPGQ